jgi:hypothetical protein
MLVDNLPSVKNSDYLGLAAKSLDMCFSIEASLNISEDWNGIRIMRHPETRFWFRTASK